MLETPLLLNRFATMMFASFRQVLKRSQVPMAGAVAMVKTVLTVLTRVTPARTGEKP
jgi:hypothetical protein